MKKKSTDIIRWILILPVALFLIYSSLTIIDLLGKVTSSTFDRLNFYSSNAFLYFWSPLSTIICAFLVIVISTLIAPYNKKVIVTIGLTFFIIMGLGMGFTSLKSSIDGDRLNWLFGDFGYVLGSLFALFKYKWMFLKASSDKVIGTDVKHI